MIPQRSHFLSQPAQFKSLMIQLFTKTSPESHPSTLNFLQHSFGSESTFIICAILAHNLIQCSRSNYLKAECEEIYRSMVEIKVEMETKKVEKQMGRGFANSNKYNNKMEQSKSPKSLAYARLGKQSSTKNVHEEHKKMKRNSTGNIYQEIMGQFNPDHNKYIRDLVNKNEQEEEERPHLDAIHNRRKSYADLVVTSLSKERDRPEKVREERETLCRPKYNVENILLQQATPKSGQSQILMRAKATPAKQMVSSFKKQPQSEPKSFLQNLGNYLQELTDCSQQFSRVNVGEKLTETLKISSGDQSHKLVSKLQQSQIKIKELKLKNYLQEKEFQKFARKEAKMKESLYEMLSEIKDLTSELSAERKERRRLERIVENFQMRKIKPERKTIGKHYQLRMELENDFNDFTENEYDRSDLESSLREGWKNATADKKQRVRNPIRIVNQRVRSGLDEEQIEKLFGSNYRSSDSDNE